MYSGHLQSCIGEIGLKVAGKGTIAKRLVEKHGYTVLVTSDAIYDACVKEGLVKPTTTDMQDMGDKRKLEFGAGYWMEVLLKRADELQISRLIIDGIRNPAEIEVLSKMLGGKFLPIGVIAPYDRRLEWFFKRQKPSDVMDAEWFKAMDARDRGVGQPEHGQQVEKTLAVIPSEFVYHNDGGIEGLYAFVDRVAAFVK